MTDTRHRPYVMTDPPENPTMEELVRYLSDEYAKVQQSMNGVDLDIETRWDEIRVPLSLARASGATSPTDASWKTSQHIWLFDPDANNEMFFDVNLPHTYKKGSPLKPHMHLVFNSTAAPGDQIVVGLSHTLANIGDTFPADTDIQTIYTATATVQPDVHISVGIPDITASGAEIMAMMGIRMWRWGTHADDTFAGDIGILEVDFAYELDSHGSEYEDYKET